MTRDEEWLLREKYNGEKTEGFFVDCERLQAGEPLAYLIGSIPFLNTTIFLDSKPLIPRTETEFWVEKIITGIKKLPDQNLHILDLCAGSGCIGVAVLIELPMTHVDFCEIDVRHHPTIQKNISQNSINPSRTHILAGNLFEDVTQKYDYILTNPPYIDASLNRTDESVKAHEPALALYGGTNGMEIIKPILEEAPAFLTENGTVIIEHEPEQSEVIHAHAKPCGFACTTHEDQFGTERYTVCSRVK